MTEWYPTENDEKINDLMTQLREAKAELDRLMKWQKIETAPEMTDILVYSSDKRQAVAYYDLTDMDGFYDEPIRVLNVYGLFLSNDTKFKPTHWMELPEPPK